MAFIPVEYREQWEPSSLSQHAMALRCTLTALNGDWQLSAMEVVTAIAYRNWRVQHYASRKTRAILFAHVDSMTEG